MVPGEGGLAGPDHRNDLAAVAAHPAADALMVVGGGRLLTVVRRRDREAFELGAQGWRRCPCSGWPRPQSPPISTLPPAAAARRIDAGALASLMSSLGDEDRAACVPFFLPAAASVPEILTVWVGGARRLACPGGGAEHNHAVVPADRVGLDHAAGVMTESTTTRARGGG